MLGSGGVEAVVELHRTPDAEVAIALEDCLHALSSVHLAGFLAVHSYVKGTGTWTVWGLGFCCQLGRWRAHMRGVASRTEYKEMLILWNRPM